MWEFVNMKTFGDRAKDLYQNYIAPKKEDLDKGAKELHVTAPKKYGSGIKKNSGWFLKNKKLTPIEQRGVAEQSPLLMKGIRKKCMDGTRAWHELIVLPNRGNAIQEDLAIINAFKNRTMVICLLLLMVMILKTCGKNLLRVLILGKLK